MIILTLIRTLQWILQCVGRCQRTFKNKNNGFIFTPADDKMIELLNLIGAGDIKSATANPPEENTKEQKDNESDGTPRTIQALSSSAHINGKPIYESYNPIPILKESQSEKEKRLRKEINDVINRIVGISNSGNRKTKERIFWLRVSQLVNNGRDENGKIIRKKLKEFSVPELQTCRRFFQKPKITIAYVT